MPSPQTSARDLTKKRSQLNGPVTLSTPRLLRTSVSKSIMPSDSEPLSSARSVPKLLMQAAPACQVLRRVVLVHVQILTDPPPSHSFIRNRDALRASTSTLPADDNSGPKRSPLPGGSEYRLLLESLHLIMTRFLQAHLQDRAHAPTIFGSQHQLHLAAPHPLPPHRRAGQHPLNLQRAARGLALVRHLKDRILVDDFGKRQS